MPGEFLNTYHFVPVWEGGPTLGPTHDVTAVRKALEENRAGAAEWGPWSHGRWHDGHCSGRITCTLTTEDPVVIGAEQEADANGDGCTVVKPYLLEGKPAIPPTTLKGMLSAIVEAATNSAMRVLDDREMSVRQETGKALSAVGMVRQRPGTDGQGDGDWELIPLTLPTLREVKGGGGGGHAFPIPAAFQTLMRKGRWTPAHKVHVGYLNWPKSAPGTRNPPPPSPDGDFQFMMDQGTYTADAPRFFLMDPVPLTLDPNGRSVVCDATEAHLKLPKNPGSPAFLLGQRVKAGQPLRPIPEAEATDEQRRTMTRGILRVMHHADRVADLPHTRKHEIFIPLPPDLKQAPRLPIPAEVVREFLMLAAERTRTQPSADKKSGLQAHPFHPIKTKRNTGADERDKRLRLKDGDLVFFGLAEEPTPRIEAISFSSIWRKSVGRVHDYVPADARPLHPQRTTLSPAELMFGVVEVRPDDTVGNKSAPETVALKGRVRCTPARTDRGEDAFMTPEPSVRLKILASPKPPSPALYFRPKGDRYGFIEKAKLSKEDHEARGRKMYLHPAAAPLGERALNQAISRTPANDPSNNQRNRVRPLKPQVAFTFHVDFDDLPPDCVDLLLFACRPTDAFRHTLGMGKALGLGRCRIDVTRVELIDRPRRYRADDPFAAPRARDHWAPGRTHDRLDPAAAARRVVDRMDDVLLGHLLGIGEPRHIGSRPVHPPYTRDQQTAVLKHQPEAETETFAWFAAVYRTVKPTKHQHLRDIRLTRAAADAADPVAALDLPPLVPEGTTPPPKGPTRPPRPPRPTAPVGPEITGTVKFYDPTKGKGYMARDGGGADVRLDGAVVETCGLGRLYHGEKIAVSVRTESGKPVAATIRRHK